MENFSNVQLDFDTIPRSAEVQYLPLDRNFVYIMLVNILLVFFGLLGLLIYLWTAIDKVWFENNFQWMLLVLLVLFLAQLAFLYKSFHFKGYAFRQRDISYKTGWLWRSITTVPYNRVQHGEVSQSLFDRYFGLARLKIYTAGGSSSDVVVPGLRLEQATELKDFILEKIKEDE